MILKFLNKIIVLGSETSSKDTFLEVIKSDYHYVKYSMGGGFMYYRFDFFEEEPAEWFYKMSLKFYASTNFDNIKKSLNDYINMKLLIMSIDPRNESAVDEIHQLNEDITQHFKLMKSKKSKVVEEGEEINQGELNSNDPPIPVYIVINHWDSNERKIGTGTYYYFKWTILDALLIATERYGYSLIELSSISWLNLDFLINHIINEVSFGNDLFT